MATSPDTGLLDFLEARARRRRARGRPLGSAVYRAADLALCRVMQPLAVRGASLWQAALSVVDRAPGGGSDRARVLRLIDRYRERGARRAVDLQTLRMMRRIFRGPLAREAKRIERLHQFSKKPLPGIKLTSKD